jgi:hypothetical protein
MSSLDWERALSDVDTNPDVEFYQPEISYRGSTRPFRPAPVVIARPAAPDSGAPRPGPDGDLLVGMAWGGLVANIERKERGVAADRVGGGAMMRVDAPGDGRGGADPVRPGGAGVPALRAPARAGRGGRGRARGLALRRPGRVRGRAAGGGGRGGAMTATTDTRTSWRRSA